VRQIALNLLLNASSAAPQGGSVSLEVREDLGGLKLAVTDDGPGISDAARARLMSEAPVEPGGGVGLRLVRDLVAVLGGSVDCDRAEGRTEITVRLPAGGEPPC
jgi:signal transduction histidine kinase